MDRKEGFKMTGQSIHLKVQLATRRLDDITNMRNELLLEVTLPNTANDRFAEKWTSRQVNVPILIMQETTFSHLVSMTCRTT